MLVFRTLGRRRLTPGARRASAAPRTQRHGPGPPTGGLGRGLALAPALPGRGRGRCLRGGGKLVARVRVRVSAGAPRLAPVSRMSFQDHSGRAQHSAVQTAPGFVRLGARPAGGKRETQISVGGGKAMVSLTVLKINLNKRKND